MPYYGCLHEGSFLLEETGVKFKVPIAGRSEEVGILKAKLGSVPVFLVNAGRYFDRPNMYGSPETDYPDNAERFAVFNRAALEFFKRDPPTIFHANDWQAALSIVFLKSQPERYQELSRTKTVMTVHNLGYQGLFPYTDWPVLDLDSKFFNMHQLEFWGKINLLKGGLIFSDAITTVSPSYAGEIKTPEEGFGLEGVFQEHSPSLKGILNGADYETWDPKIAPCLQQPTALATFPANVLVKAACSGVSVWKKTLTSLLSAWFRGW
jgi:starch synthase